MKKLVLGALLLGLVVISCKKDDDGGSDNNCQTCDAYTLQGVTFPEVEVCKGDNGNAFVAGQDTTVSFSQYITSLEVLTSCN